VPQPLAISTKPTAALPRLRLESHQPIRAAGKFLFAGSEKFLIKGVTYGPFGPDAQNGGYRDRASTERDFRAMAEHGLNSVRTYTVPPAWMLDTAAGHGLRVMLGLPWEQHVAFLDDRRLARRIRQSVRDNVRMAAGHPAVLAFTIGNEIPAPIVRWHGHARIERFLRELHDIAKSEAPDSLVTYVSYPTTEYLDLPFLDVVAFNVFLETRPQLAHYLAHLQNIAGERPLLLAEAGLDSMRNGEAKQAATLDWQLRTAAAAGCAGAFVFSWSDQWYRGGQVIDDWAFGLCARDGRPKPALTAVADAFAAGPCDQNVPLPRISVVICTYNGSRTIRECLDGVAALRYPDFEVVVIDDGSKDTTAAIVQEYLHLPGWRMVRIPNGGLSNARNLGMREATGEIVAYLDDDAWPDPDWLLHLAATFQQGRHAGVGGPNLAPAGDGPIAECVANSPGGPSHVLHANLDAEHVPGCNMAFRKAALQAIEGFDVRFRIAGDDVDLCWRLQERGNTLGFSAGAMVWHHRRNSVRAYLRQQRNYGRAEGMLESKWPEKYNRLGHMRWAGQLYGKGHTRPISQLGRRIDHGVWGTALFQPMYAENTRSVWALTLAPEWYLIVLGLLALASLGWSWSPLLLLWPLALGAAAIPVLQAWLSARKVRFHSARGRLDHARLVALTMALHLLQPMARLLGRLQHRLTPWRLHGAGARTLPFPRRIACGSEQWRSS
jgi:GT2 family glycosyltransferase